MVSMLCIVLITLNFLLSITHFDVKFVCGHVKNEATIILKNASLNQWYLGNVSRLKEEIWFFSYNESQDNQVRSLCNEIDLSIFNN